MSKLLLARLRKRIPRVNDSSEQHSLEELPDEDLLCRIARGDREAFDVIYLRHKARLRRFIARFVQDDESAEDLLQEAFLRVLQNADKYRPVNAFTSWLYRITANLCLNELRRRRTHRSISLNAQVHVAVTDSENETIELHELIPDSSVVGPGEAAEAAETMRRIISALGTLSTAHQQVVTLRLWEELQFEQIAGLLNCSIGTAKSRAYYGLRALRDKLESELEEES